MLLDHFLLLQDGICITDRLNYVSALVLAIGQLIMGGEQVFVNIIYLDTVHRGIIILARKSKIEGRFAKDKDNGSFERCANVRRSSLKNSSIVMDILVSSLGSSASSMSFAAYARQQFFASFTSL